MNPVTVCLSACLCVAGVGWFGELWRVLSGMWSGPVTLQGLLKDVYVRCV